MSRQSRVAIGFVLMLGLTLALVATGAPLWLRILGLGAGIFVWYRWLWRHGGIREEWREAIRKALAKERTRR